MSEMMQHLRSLADGVRGMGVGDPDAGDRVEASDVILWAVAEIARLRGQPCPYVTGTVTQYCTLTPFTLTDAEREAVEWCVEMASTTATDCAEEIATLRGLLERTK